ncbi:MAG TPA: cupin domain-containing protein [Opitutaceae bacterium]|nr:cupin domain-containing protein [Opitutaceae bacterium]
MKSAGLSCLSLILVAAMSAADAPPPVQGSAVWKWEDLVAKPTPVGERRDIANAPTATLERFTYHASTLLPGRASHAPHTHAQEELIVVKAGTLEVHLNGAVERVGAGSVLFFGSNDAHAVTNVGDVPATYQVFNFYTAATRTLGGRAAREAADAAKTGSAVFAWDRLAVAPTGTGERRQVRNAATTTLASLSCHVTTLRGGIAAHAAHRHPDEELVLVKEGEIEVTINGRSQRAGPGAVFFFASNDEHGMRNAGDSTASYYVIRFSSDRTPARGH